MPSADLAASGIESQVATLYGSKRSLLSSAEREADVDNVRRLRPGLSWLALMASISSPELPPGLSSLTARPYLSLKLWMTSP